jgi:hypothetical protein
LTFWEGAMNNAAPSFNIPWGNSPVLSFFALID